MVATWELVRIHRLPRRRSRPMLWRSSREREVGGVLFGRSRRFLLYEYGRGFQVYDVATHRWVPRAAVGRICGEFLDTCRLLQAPLRQKEARDALVKLGLSPEDFEDRCDERPASAGWPSEGGGARRT